MPSTVRDPSTLRSTSSPCLPKAHRPESNPVSVASNMLLLDVIMRCIAKPLTELAYRRQNYTDNCRDVVNTKLFTAVIFITKTCFSIVREVGFAFFLGEVAGDVIIDVGEQFVDGSAGGTAPYADGAVAVDADIAVVVQWCDAVD
jgi:hypothetical protein